MNFEITDRKTLKNNSKELIKIYLILSQFLVIQEAPWAKFPHSPIHHYTSIYGALFLSVSPVRCTCIIKYGAVRKFFRTLYFHETCKWWENVCSGISLIWQA